MQSICKYYFAPISSLTSFLINNRMDLITESFQPAPRTQKPRKWVICHKLYSEKQDEFSILATFVCNSKFKFFIFKKKNNNFPLIVTL